LSSTLPESPEPFGRPHAERFVEGLRDRGYVEGRNVIIEYRFAEGDFKRLPGLMTELLDSDVDVIVTADQQAMRVAEAQANGVPLIMTASGDPVASGRVASLAEPGGNITGFLVTSPSVMGKRFEILRDIVPFARRVGVLWQRSNTSQNEWKEAEAAAAAVGVELVSLEVEDGVDVIALLAIAKETHVDAVLAFGTVILNMQRERIVSRANELSLPVMGATAEWAEAGAVASYAPDLGDNFRRAAGYADKILHGQDPGKLPIERPEAFESVVNLKAARAHGLSINPDTLLSATRVIE
jgi:putative ABC transport system substrate-binding protein